MDDQGKKQVNAIIVHQWLREWNDVLTSEEQHRLPPAHQFYLFSLSAAHLKKLSKVYQRRADKPRENDLAVQRSLEKPRVEEIAKFIYGGYPWSELSENQKKSTDFKDLRMPGWLPTAIVANILPIGAKRNGGELISENAIRIEKVDEYNANIIFPDNYLLADWNPEVPPIEIIDGQHRLYAFENIAALHGDFDLPVVAFYNLDTTWKAYLFYTINIKPKKINTSLAYDLYPLLRIQDWLEKAQDGPAVYRETRAQELTENLWSHPASPWKDRINMLGEKRGGDVTQAAFVRGLMSTYLKRGAPLGGLFGDELHKKKGDLLQWDRIKQSAFLIAIWQAVRDAIIDMEEEWMVCLRSIARQDNLPIENLGKFDPAFSGQFSLLATDQGVRGILYVTNDMCFAAADHLNLRKWVSNDSLINDFNERSISESIQSFKKESAYDFLRELSRIIARFDWRASSVPMLPDEIRRRQMIYKGSSGYREMRKQLLEIIIESAKPSLSTLASQIRGRIK